MSLAFVDKNHRSLQIEIDEIKGLPSSGILTGSILT
jgi:hypothetical protein